MRPLPLQGVGVEILGLSVTHLGQSIKTLDIDHLTVEQGASLAIVGETGSGKSTLVGVLAGIVPFEGEIRVGRRGVAPVFQETFLFGTTLRENLLFGSHRSESEITDALEIAGAFEFVAQLPDGIDTIVGERGVGLSGGQRQRLALARALLAGRDVLVLDDTTSALDAETEAMVMTNLLLNRGERTLIVIASRPSTVAMIGEVLFLVDGRIADRGSHDELLSRCPRYAELMESYESDRHAR